MADEKLAGSVTISSACQTVFSFETNGHQGGDGGHGGYLDVTIDGTSNTMMNMALDGRPMSQGGTGDRKITIRFLGDCELENAAKGFEFLAKRIRQALHDRS